MSVLQKANSLAAMARAYIASKDESDNRERVERNLEQIESEVAKLTSLANAFVAARAAGVPLSTASLEPDRGLRTLRERAAVAGLPSPQQLLSGRNAIQAVNNAIGGELQANWPSWAQGTIKSLQTERITRLPFQQRPKAKTWLGQLHDGAKSIPANATTINSFIQIAIQLGELLSTIQADDPVVLLLNRIRRESMTLSDLSIDELELLRADADASAQVQLVVR